MCGPSVMKAYNHCCYIFSDRATYDAVQAKKVPVDFLCDYDFMLSFCRHGLGKLDFKYLFAKEANLKISYCYC